MGSETVLRKNHFRIDSRAGVRLRQFRRGDSYRAGKIRTPPPYPANSGYSSRNVATLPRSEPGCTGEGEGGGGGAGGWERERAGSVGRLGYFHSGEWRVRFFTESKSASIAVTCSLRTGSGRSVASSVCRVSATNCSASSS